MRNNEDRLGPKPGEASDGVIPEVFNGGQAQTGLSFSVPTEFVELPSAGRFYPEGHPLHGAKDLEIKFMTAKEEDILSSTALIKRGVALDRLIDSIMVNKNIKGLSLLTGDRNAILVAARASAFGSSYETIVECPACSSNEEHVFDLEEKKIVNNCTDQNFLAENKIKHDEESGLFLIELPKSKVVVGVSLMTGHEESKLFAQNSNKKGKGESVVTDQLMMIIKAVNGDDDRWTIKRFVGVMPISDSKHLRKLYSQLTPAVDLTQTFACSNCGHIEDMEVPFNTDFFWPG
tara:strand:+ start:6495 stop:7364 length:870 start_codon:yes stop_codon:yes gene_type:complete